MREVIGTQLKPQCCQAWLLIASGDDENILSGRIRVMTNVLLEELVLTVRANEAESFKSSLYEG